MPRLLCRPIAGAALLRPKVDAGVPLEERAFPGRLTLNLQNNGTLKILGSAGNPWIRILPSLIISTMQI